MRRRLALVLVLLAQLAAGGRWLAAQEQPAVPLERFMVQVARLWGAGDADALVALAPADGKLLLDIGAETGGVVQGRHATAALRALFAGRETVSARPTRATIAGSHPPRGFGEVAWISHPRGMPATQSRTLYVGVVWESGGWRIRELRLLR